MEKTQKVQLEKVERNKKKKRVLHYLIVYLVCLLVACLTWLSVRYSMRAEENDTLSEASSVTVISPITEDLALYV